ncbi:MAG: cytochrome [Patescibacteria group bacterium]
MRRKLVVGVMGPGRVATDRQIDVAYKVGRMIAEAGCNLLNGGVAHGVMDASARGAAEIGGVEIIGVTPHKQPSETHPVSEHVTILIETTFGEGRNLINARSSDLVIAIGMCPGTASEVCFAIKAGKPIFLMDCPSEAHDFFRALGGNVQIGIIEHIRSMLMERA